MVWPLVLARGVQDNTPEALEIARAAEKLNAEVKRAALGMVEGLQRVYPYGLFMSTGMAS
jgi:hypothetical protein